VKKLRETIGRRLLLMAGTLALTAVLLAACGNDDDTPTLVIGGIPDQDVAQLEDQFGLIVDYLKDTTGFDVRYAPSNDYAAIVTAFQRGDVHLAWFGGLTGVQARAQVPGAEAIAQRPIDAAFYAIFITHSSIEADSLEDLRGLSFTFGSESSTSGHLMPRAFLIESGIDPDEDFDGPPGYSGSHDQVYSVVASGAFQAGALNEAVWDRAVAEGRANTDNLRLVDRVGPYYNYNWTVRPDFDEVFGDGARERVTEALLNVANSDHPLADDIMARFGGSSEGGFIPASNDLYENLRLVAVELGIIR
jgi:phosphonate transport system substrate-binding protein